MYQQVGARAVAQDVRVVAGIAGDHRDTTLVLDAIAIGRLDGIAVIDRERDDGEIAGLINDAVLGELLYRDCDMLARELLVLDPDFDVMRIGRFEMMHESRGADRPDHIKGSPPIAEMRTQPARQPEIGNSDRVIAVKMREQQRVDPADGNAELKQPHGGAAPGIDQHGVIARFDQCARTEAIGTGDWHPRPEQCDAKSSHYGCNLMSASSTTFFQCAI